MDAMPAQSFEQALDALLHASVKRLLRDPAPGPYLDWLARYGRSLGAGLLPPEARGSGDAAEAARLMRLFGHMIYAMLPLPQHQFQPRPLAVPGPTDACMCGSRRPFQQCCESLLANLPKLPAEMAMPHVLAAIGKPAWASLPALGVAPRLIEAAAERLRHEQRLKEVIVLLEPWAAQPGRYPDAWASLLDLLCDLYADLDKPRKRRTLARAMIERGEPAVQSKGWQRLCLMATDAGRRTEAASAFAQAQRLAPDDPALSLLELSMLLGFGETAHAAERAQFHIRRLSRMNEEGRHDDLIRGLSEMGERGHRYLEDMGLRHDPELARLTTWLAALPAPQLRIDLERATSHDLGVLVPLPALQQLMEQWQLGFPQGEPMLASEQPGADPWPCFERWMSVLETEPELADSFEVLDGLLLALHAHERPGAPVAARQVLQRALDLWRVLRERFPKAACHWGLWPNRPALRLLAQHVVADATPTAAHSFEWLRHLVEVLNPADNHGLRARLAEVFLRRGMYDEALALCERYPGDMDQMLLAHVLALWHGRQRGAATTLLADTLRANPKLAKVMRTARQPQPRQGEHIAAGAHQQAQLAYAKQWDLWQDAELRAMLMAVSRRAGSR